MPSDLPYCDHVLEEREREREARPDDAPGARHIHWGYWPRPRQADLSGPGVQAATDQMVREHWPHARLGPGRRVLDVGCGMGGTLALVDRAFAGQTLCGVNIDPRQVRVARTEVVSANGNRVEFQVADACRLPFRDGAFDTVFAVECIFHFGSRETFLSEARRVLRPGGRLVFSDLVIARVPRVLRPFVRLALRLRLGRLAAASRRFYGKGSAIHHPAYLALLESAGFTILECRDVTPHVMPNHDAARVWAAEVPADFTAAARYLEALTRMHLLRYRLYALEKPSAT